MGGFLSQLTAEEPKSATQQKQVTQTGNNYGTPQKKIELNDPRSPTQNLDRTPVVVKGIRKFYTVAVVLLFFEEFNI